jgi:hypothetical protein
VRGFLNDPRIQGPSRAFHFGIDVSVADGTPVYAVEAGTAYASGRLTVTLRTPSRDFGYWHVVPAVAREPRSVARHAVLGHVARGWGHVHLSERAGGRYLNPLRRGGIEPYEDDTPPTISAILLRREGRRVPPEHVTGKVDLLVEAYDTPPLPVPPPWADMPVSPVLLRWRLLRGGAPLLRWQTGIDFRNHLRQEAFREVYARGSRQNRPGKPGRYLYCLRWGLDTTAFADGPCRLQVEALDSRDNLARAGLSLTLANR